MPRDPKDTSVSGGERRQRRLAEALDIKEPALLRSGGGAAGAEGKAGKDGATWLSGTTVPAVELGAVGDFYFRTTTSDVYKKTGEAIWSFQVNLEGAEGAAGTNGSTWYSGEGVPAGGTGVNGDYYIRTATSDVYKKVAGVWEIILNIKGAEGAAGAGGKEGPAGSAENIDWKNSVRAATTANIATATALNPGDAIDGVTLVENDRVLVKDQTTKSQNGIWVVKAVPSRALDADAAAELSGGSTIYVEEGTRNKRRTFQIITPGNITPGTTAHEYQQLGFRDFGLVAALPSTEAVKNDKCTYIASEASGVTWDLIYSGTGTKWYKIGGPPLVTSSSVLRELTNQTSYVSLPTDPLSLTLPLKGDYDIEIMANILPVSGGGASAGQARLSYAVGATAAANDWGLSNQQRTATAASGDQQISLSKKTRWTGLAAAVKVEEKGLTPSALSSGFISRRLWADPVWVE